MPACSCPHLDRYLVNTSEASRPAWIDGKPTRNTAAAAMSKAQSTPPYGQDLPPPEGFEQIRYRRNLPVRGPGGAVVFGGVFAICAFGFWRLGLGNLERRWVSIICMLQYILSLILPVAHPQRTPTRKGMVENPPRPAHHGRRRPRHIQALTGSSSEREGDHEGC